MKAYYSPNGGCEKALLDLIKYSTTYMNIAVYSFTNKTLADAIQNQGIPTRLILDESQTHGKQAEIHDQLEEAKIPIKLSKPSHGIMHNKYAIYDGLQLSTGSYNWTNNAEHSNRENLLLLDDYLIVSAYQGNYEKLWQEAKPEVAKEARTLARENRMRTTMAFEA